MSIQINPAGNYLSLEMFVACIFLSSEYFQAFLLAFHSEGHVLVFLDVSFLRLMHLNDIIVHGDGNVPKFAFLLFSVALNKSALRL